QVPLFCPHCGSTTAAKADHCVACGAPFALSSVAAGVLPIDTTGLPPGATFGPSPGEPAGTTAEITDRTTRATLSTSAATGGDPAEISGPLQIGQSFGA